MFGVAVTPGHLEWPASGRLSAWTQDYLREAAVADLGCAVVGVSAAAQLLFGHDHELAVASLVTELHRGRYHRPALPDEAGPYRPVASQPT